jgi:hypothetical protein
LFRNDLSSGVTSIVPMLSGFTKTAMSDEDHNLNNTFASWSHRLV